VAAWPGLACNRNRGAAGAHLPARGLEQRQRRQERVHGRDEREAAAGQRAAAGQPRAVRRPEQVGLAQPPGAQQERRRRACARRRGSVSPPPASQFTEHQRSPPAASVAGCRACQHIAAAKRLFSVLSRDAKTLCSRAPVCRARLSTARRPPAQHQRACCLLPCRPLAIWQRFEE